MFISFLVPISQSKKNKQKKPDYMTVLICVSLGCYECTEHGSHLDFSEYSTVRCLARKVEGT